jgi:general secretion pathway protein D
LVKIATANSDNISINKFALKVSNHNNINIYVDEEIQDKKVSLFVPNKISNSDLFTMFKNTVSKLKYNLKKIGDTYYLSKKVNFSKRSYIYKLRFDTHRDVETLLSSFGIIHSYLQNSNSFIIKCTSNEYLKIKNLISRTDVKSKQVILKVTIFEINEGSLKERGIQYGSIYRGIDGTIQTAINAILSPISTNNPISGTSNFYAALRLLNQDGQTKILQNPFILAKHNKKFKFEAVDNIPYLVTTTKTEATNTSEQNSIEYKDVGLKLNGKVFIHQDYIDLDLDLISEDLISNESEDMPTTYKRVLKSNSNLSYDEILLLSGLRREKKEENIYSIPYLCDIPYIGFLFEYKSRSISNTSITVAIEVIKKEDISKEFKILEKTNHTKKYEDNSSDDDIPIIREEED